MLPPDGLWTTDSAVVRYNATDKASQSVFWENELLSTEKLLEEIEENVRIRRKAISKGVAHF